MSMKSTPERYGTVALTLHWLSAALILSLIPMGFAMQSVPESLRLGLYGAHVVLGILIGLLTLVRLVWWMAFDRRPQASHEDPPYQRFLAKAVHAGFYIALIVLAVSGIRMLVISPLGTMLAAGDLSLMPMKLDGRPPRLVHGLMARLLMGLFVLHLIGALYHHWIRRDGALERMSFR